VLKKIFELKKHEGTGKFEKLHNERLHYFYPPAINVRD
jgi:hypothetical protein